MKRDFLTMADASKELLESLLSRADFMKKNILSGNKSMDLLKGKNVITLFYENSTRTRCSFESAAKYLGASAIGITSSGSSVKKGESLIDTAVTLDKMMADAIVIRHSVAGAPAIIAKHTKASVINAGDGMNEHPTQALLDMLTMRENFKSLKGLKVAILGDIRHSRVAKSNLYGLTKLGASVSMYAPRTLMPAGLDKMGARVCRSREEALDGADVVMGLRIQLERQQGGNFPSLGEYAKYYGVNEAVMNYAKKGALIMHPGPVNRGVELTSGLIDGADSRIEEQVLSGVAVRMAVLSLLTKGEK